MKKMYLANTFHVGGNDFLNPQYVLKPQHYLSHISLHFLVVGSLRCIISRSGQP